MGGTSALAGRQVLFVAGQTATRQQGKVPVLLCGLESASMIENRAVLVGLLFIAALLSLGILFSSAEDLRRAEQVSAAVSHTPRRPIFGPLRQRKPAGSIDLFEGVSIEEETEFRQAHHTSSRDTGPRGPLDVQEALPALSEVPLVPLAQVMAACHNVRHLLHLHTQNQVTQALQQQLVAFLQSNPTACLDLPATMLSELGRMIPFASSGSARSALFICEFFLCIVATTSTSSEVVQQASSQIGRLVHVLKQERLFLSAQHRLYLRELARAELRLPTHTCTRRWGGTTNYLSSGSYGITYVRCLYEEQCFQQPRAVIKLATTQTYLGLRSSATLSNGQDPSVESFFLEATRILVEG